MSQRSNFKTLRSRLENTIVGQPKLLNQILIALLADGHLLVEGAPGLAKTKTIKALADALEGSFQRIQFTPDLLPADITGTEIYRPQDGSFHFQPGPIFHSIVLADEVNRAPAKVQAALLEAMAERQVSVGKKTHPLPELFLVMATQNPIEQEGTYPLPEAQLDRFLIKATIDYPDLATERKILHLARREVKQALASANTPDKVSKLPQAAIFAARQEILNINMVPEVEDYLLQMIVATRDPGKVHPPFAGQLDYGASPRATLALDRCARAHAWLQDREFVTPDDVQMVLPDVLQHRIGLSFAAEADGLTPLDFIEELLLQVSAP